MAPFILLSGLLFSASCPAADSPSPEPQEAGYVLMLQAAPTAIHYHSSPEYKGTPWLVGAEVQFPSRWLGGYSYFRNSFDQPSHYLYAGRWWPVGGGNWYVKLTGGVIEGYKEPYEDKIAYNHNGYAPALIPALGYKIERFNVQLNLLGTAAFMVTLGYNFVR